MEKNEVTFGSIFDSSSLWDEKGTFSALSQDGATRTSFFITPPDMERLERLSALTNARRPDRDGDGTETAFLDEHILWPRQVLFSPRAHVVWPVIPKAFLFGADSSPDKALSAVRQGRPKKSLWFLSEKSLETMTPQERGDSASLLRAMADLARAVAFLHRKGFACCGLSDETVLLDAAHGRAFLTGTENFRAPDFPSPASAVSPAYAAPELFDAKRDGRAADMQTLRNADLHALAVLFYRLLLRRHPFIGPKRREYGPDALFIENPVDKSNRPDELNFTIQNLDEPLEGLFLNAFTHGLRDPRERPTAIQWENALDTARRRHEELKHHEARKRDVNISKTLSVPLTRPESVRVTEALPSALSHAGALPSPVNLRKAAGGDASRTFNITLEWSQTEGSRKEGIDLDISAFLKRDGAVSVWADDMVFYSATTHASGSVSLWESVPSDLRQKAQKIMIVERDLIPSDVSRVDFVVTAYTDSPKYCFNAVKDAFLSVCDGNGAVQMRVDLRRTFGDCSACLVASLVRQDGQMRLTGPGQGHGGGLRDVCRRYGIPITG